MNETCNFIDIIDECIKELSLESPLSEDLVEPPTIEAEKEDEDEYEYLRPYTKDNLKQCLAITPDPMLDPKEPMVELKKLPKNLRYEFLDNKVNLPVIVNENLTEDEITKLLMEL